MDGFVAIILGLIAAAFLISIFASSIATQVTDTWRAIEKSKQNHICPKCEEPLVCPKCAEKEKPPEEKPRESTET